MTQIKKGLLNQQQANMFINKMAQTIVPQSSNGWSINTGTSTGNYRPQYEEECEVSQIIQKHSKNYWYIISVSDNEDVFFDIYRSGKLAYWWFKLTGRCHSSLNDVSGGWVTVKKRTHLPATLGAAYREIDQYIEDHKKIMEHDKYITGILKTNPDNLKMIEGLERLAEGEPEVQQPTAAQYISFNTGQNTGTQAVNNTVRKYTKELARNTKELARSCIMTKKAQESKEKVAEETQ